MKTITEIANALEAKRAELKAALAAVKGEDGQVDVEAAQAKMPTFDQTKAEIAALEDELKAAQALADLDAANDAALKDMRKVERTVALPVKDEAKSFGELVVESAAMKGYDGDRGPVAHIDVDLKTLFNSTSYAPQITRTGVLAEVINYPTTVLDAIQQTPTGQPTVRYQQETWTNAAGETEEGAAYPEATLSYEDVDEPVRKVAVFLPVTDEELEDIEGLQGLLNGRLVRMIQLRLNGQIVNGNGTAPNIKGVLARTGLNTVTLDAAGGEKNAEAIFRGIQTTRSAGAANPKAIFMNPMDWAKLVTEKATGSGEYLNGRYMTLGPDTLFGLPVIQTDQLTAGTVLIVDTDFVELRVRRGMDVQIGYSNDDFTKGKKSIRADVRVALMVIRPQAVTKVTGIA